MTFTLHVPRERIQALSWVADIVLRGMLHVSVDVRGWADSQIVLCAEGRKLSTPSVFSGLSEVPQGLASEIPSVPLAVLKLDAILDAPLTDDVPVLFGRPEIIEADREISCHIDIFGSIFFMLSRFEEVALSERDAHDRFPATASLAWRNGFLYRPIVDEYAELLWALMKRLWPGLSRSRRQGDINVSCDVDQPFDRIGQNPVMLARIMRYELIKKRRPAMAFQRLANFVVHRLGSHRFDPFYTFDWYMDVCERHGRRAAFYFIADHSHPTMDGTYEIEDPRIVALMRDIDRRGHEIGMHGSYNTYHSGPHLIKERQCLQLACLKAGIYGEFAGNRQHYLRFDAAKTPDLLDAAGFEYDASGSFADRPGFRYGTSHSFHMWSWETLSPLRIKQRPLILMEASVMSAQYLGLEHTDDARNLMQVLKDKALCYGGDFNLLWHNSELFEPADRKMFEELLD